jgi:RNA polymerase sigma factor (sigma-70 family)
MMLQNDSVLAARIAAEIPWLRRRAFTLVYSQADADDLVQDCLAAALNNIGALRHPERLRRWLLSILINVFRMRLRARARRAPIFPIDDFSDSIAASVSPEDGDAAQDLACAMGKLSAEHRKILVLVDLEGQSYREAADILGLPVGTVMSRLARARHGLRALLGEPR